MCICNALLSYKRYMTALDTAHAAGKSIVKAYGNLTHRWHLLCLGYSNLTLVHPCCRSA